MPNLRIIYDNASDRATAITATGLVSGFPTANLQNDYKGRICRTNSVSGGTRSTQYGLTWGSPEVIGAVCLPAINIGASATIRMRLYSGAAYSGLLYDSGIQYACPGSNLGDWNWNFPLNSNAFAFGGLSKVVLWCSNSNQYACRSMHIDIVDTTDLDTNIDCSRIICGAYWEPLYNVQRDALSILINDTSSSNRNNAGDLLSDRGVVHDQLNFDFALLPESDRQELLKILRSVGTNKNILVSIFPKTNEVNEQDYLVYGKRSNSGIGSVYFKYYSHSVEIIGW